jgi:probable F420-dependent oxidoreductase
VLIGVLPPYRSGVVADPAWITDFALAAEAAGVESLYLVEHVAVAAGYAEAYPYSDTGRMPLPDDCPIPDPLELTAFLAARTTALRFGTGVLVGPHHHPLVLAKRLATLDVLSGGRVSAGFGVGWMREEVESTGADFSTRGRRTTELLAALRAALDDDPATHHGEFFDFTAMRVHPRPTGRIRLDVGGHSEAAARRAGRLADGLHPLGLDDATLQQRWDLARRSAEEAGRDPEELELSVTLGLGGVDTATVARLRRMGVHRIVCSAAGADGAAIEPGLRAAVDTVAG